MSSLIERICRLHWNSTKVQDKPLPPPEFTWTITFSNGRKKTVTGSRCDFDSVYFIVRRAADNEAIHIFKTDNIEEVELAPAHTRGCDNHLHLL